MEASPTSPHITALPNLLVSKRHHSSIRCRNESDGSCSGGVVAVSLRDSPSRKDPKSTHDNTPPQLCSGALCWKRDSVSAPPPPPVAPVASGNHHELALAAVQRLLGTYKAIPAAVCDAITAMHRENATSSDAAPPSPMTPTTATADGAKDRVSLFCAANGSDDGAGLLFPSASSEERETEIHRHNASSSSSTTKANLPWWKRILIDTAYRRRLMQLSAENYRAEWRLLANTPEVLSSGEAMEKRKVGRERCLWDDEISKSLLAPATTDHVLFGQVRETHGGAAADNDGGDGFSISLAPANSPTEDSAEEPPTLTTLPIDEVDELVVMAQHVVLRVGFDDIEAHFSAKHPHAIIGASAAESLQRVALGAMPPVLHERERRRQELVVKSHLASLRRFSRDTPYELKQRLARDIVTGRAVVPMQTAITDAVLDQDVAVGSSCDGRTFSAGRRQTAMGPEETVFPSVQNAHAAPAQLPGFGEDDPYTSTSVWQLPLHKPLRPPTPPWQVELLPPGAWPVEQARTEVVRAEALLHTSSVHDPFAVVKRAAAAAAVETVSQRSAHTLKPKNDSVIAAQNGDRVRRHEAAVACVDGSENLYGLQYVWRLSLPPCGFIRVSPDPRYAMWPDLEEEERGGHRRAAQPWSPASSRLFQKSDVAPTMVMNPRRQAQMRRQASRVNRRTRKLQWLHRMGRAHACYNDLPLSDSEDSEGSPMTSSQSSSLSSDVSPSMREYRAFRRKTKAAKRTHPRATRQRTQRQRDAFSCGARPVLDGALHINIYAETLSHEGRWPTSIQNADCNSAGDVLSASSVPSIWRVRPTRHFLGCYRQSRLLIHYKMYCRALYEEERVRCGGPGAHLLGRAGGSVPEYTPATEGPLAGVPVIPYPVLRLQGQAPSLRQPKSRRAPVVSTIGECRCWEGLYPTPGVSLDGAAHVSWRKLRESNIVQQSLRDVFDDLPHDKEGQLDKRTFVLFVLQLLELFLPTRLPPAVPIAIAEEEWVYRGTTEHVGPETFFEKFFGFPFIFYRDIASVTEEHLVEFWSLVRVCLDAQREKEEATTTTTTKHAEEYPAQEEEELMLVSVEPATSLVGGRTNRPLSYLSLLMPLTHFTEAQQAALVAHPPPAFDPAVYDDYCLLQQIYRSHPQVRAAPRGHQLMVARSILAHRLRRQGRPRAAVSTNTSAASGGKAHGLSDERGVALAAQSERQGGVARRMEIEAMAQREREARERRLEVRAHDALLEQSNYYHARVGHIQSHAAMVISGVESTCSAWELHRTDVYSVFREHDVHSPSNADGENEDDVEDQLLEYLDDVPLDVFDGRVSLRERYLLHAGFQQKRRHHALPWLQRRHELMAASATVAAENTEEMQWKGGRVTSLNATTASGAPVPQAPLPLRQARSEEGMKGYLAVMKGKVDASKRRKVVAAQERSLFDRAGEVKKPDTNSSNNSSDCGPLEVPTASYAAGIYPLRAVPRKLRSVLGPSKGLVQAESSLTITENDPSQSGKHPAASSYPLRRGPRVTSPTDSVDTANSVSGRTLHPRTSSTWGHPRRTAVFPDRKGSAQPEKRERSELSWSSLLSPLETTNKSYFRKMTAAPRPLSQHVAASQPASAPSSLRSSVVEGVKAGERVCFGNPSRLGGTPGENSLNVSPHPASLLPASVEVSQGITGSRKGRIPSVMFLNVADPVPQSGLTPSAGMSRKSSLVMLQNADSALPPPPPPLPSVPTPPPLLPTSSSLQYAQRLRAQQKRQQRYRRQFNAKKN